VVARQLASDALGRLHTRTPESDRASPVSARARRPCPVQRSRMAAEIREGHAQLCLTRNAKAAKRQRGTAWRLTLANDRRRCRSRLRKIGSRGVHPSSLHPPFLRNGLIPAQDFNTTFGESCRRVRQADSSDRLQSIDGFAISPRRRARRGEFTCFAIGIRTRIRFVYGARLVLRSTPRRSRCPVVPGLAHVGGLRWRWPECGRDAHRGLTERNLGPGYHQSPVSDTRRRLPTATWVSSACPLDGEPQG
jgi:hypothetical protein